MVPRIATAMMISSSVNARRRLAWAINIKFDLLQLLDTAASPLCGERHPVHTSEFDAIVFLQSGRRALLDQFHLAVTRIDAEFLCRIGKSGRGLHFSHSIGQNLTNAILLRVERAGVQAILHGATERQHAEREDR